MNKIPNLDALRFIAAFMVLIQHIELYKASAYTENSLDNRIFGLMGFVGITMFFVLSSFLITTKLLTEKENTGSISLKNFYVRRILRIWPLYYLIILLGFLVLPHVSLFQLPADQSRFGAVDGSRLFPNFFLYLIGMSGLGRTLYGDIAYLSHTWTLATEQLFYLLWPFVIILFNRNLLKAMVILIAGYHLLNYFLVTKYAYAIPYNRFIFSFISGFYIHCMAYGGIFAVIWHKKMTILKALHHPVIFYTAIAISFLFPLFLETFSVHYYDLYSILFGIIILNLATNAKYSEVLENRYTNYLGSISYGIYMFHPIIIVVAIKLSLYVNSPALIYIVSFIGTIFISHLSFKYFERYFMNLRTRKSLYSH